METYLAVKWSTSRGRDTYGYNICTVTDQMTGKRYRCMGGGYDMLGTSFGNWLQAVHQTELQAIGDRAHGIWTERDDGPWDRETNEDGLYGMNLYRPSGRVSLDGACGDTSMHRIAEAIGITLQRTWDRKGHTTGYFVTGPES